MNARTAEAMEIQLDHKAVDELKARLRGALLLPGQAGYADTHHRDAVWAAARALSRCPLTFADCGGQDGD